MSKPSDPYGELPLRNDKHAALCAELYLAKRGITSLENFGAFVQLSTLWINDNKLQKLEGLNNNIRLRNLHAHGNRIRRLEGSSLKHFKFLQRLTLNNNMLESIDDVVKEIGQLRHLKHLDLFDNPLSQEDNYRLLIISDIPWLETLDRVSVTKEDLKKASRLKHRLKQMTMFKPSNTLNVNGSIGGDCQDSLGQLIMIIRSAIVSKRVKLEEIFLEEDPRKCGMVSIPTFETIMRIYGVVDMLSDDEWDLLVSKYRSYCKFSAISATESISREMIDYHSFCNDILTTELRSRNLDKLKPWKLEKVCEVSVTARDLHKYVKTCKKEIENELQRSKREALISSSSTSSDPSCFSFTAPLDDNAREKKTTQAWIMYILRSLLLNEINSLKNVEGVPFRSINTALRGTVELSKTSVYNLFEQMSRCGKVPDDTVESCVELIFQGKNTMPLSHVWDAVGPSQTSENGVKWRDMTESELSNKEAAVFDEANAFLDELLRSSAPEKASCHLMSTTASAGIAGTRMAANKQHKSRDSFCKDPHHIISSAPNRSDIAVIPALKSAAMRAARDATMTQTHDWESEFAALGLKGDALQIAVTRKKRSMLEDLKKRERNDLSTEFPVRNDKRKKGWSPSTGTVLL